jgi:hypothetical protein
MLIKYHQSPLGCRRQTRRAGWTLVEMFVALGAGTIILLAFFSTFITLSSTMKAIYNYNDLDQSSRETLDQMSRDLRDTATVTNFTATSVSVTNGLTGDAIQYWWNSTNGTFNRSVNGVSTMMLTNCDTLAFQYYTRVPTNNFNFVTNTGNPNSIKLISISWRCSRSILGAKLNTESVQTARICIRN